MTREQSIRKSRRAAPADRIGLTQEELCIVDHLQRAIEAFAQLQGRAGECVEFRQRVNTAKNIVARRVASRANPEAWLT